MNGTELKERIAQLNSVAKTLNTKRQQDIGKRETLSKQIEEMIAQYNKVYGKSITIDTLDAELETVKKNKEAEVEKISGIITAIQTGNYELANKLAGVQTEEQKAAVANNDYVESVVSDSKVVKEPAKVTQQPSTPSMYVPTESTDEKVEAKAPSVPNVSPVSNPIDIESGTMHNPGIFSRDFSASDSDVDVAPPVAPPSLADLL